MCTVESVTSTFATRHSQGFGASAGGGAADSASAGGVGATSSGVAWGVAASVVNSGNG
jgi:hypothetical protein